MDTSKNTYESTVIVNASLDDAQIEAVVGRIQETISKNGGTITALNKWGRKRLAYSISKKTNGFYVNLEFTAPASLIILLERSYQLDEMVLRYLSIKLDKKAIATKVRALAQAAAEAELAAAPVPITVPVREPLFDGPGSTKAAE